MKLAASQSRSIFPTDVLCGQLSAAIHLVTTLNSANAQDGRNK
jgi:hypothetical protein